MIYISYIETFLGIIEIRANSRFLLSVLFVDEVNHNTTENEITKKCAKQLMEYFDGKRKKFDVEINFEGSEFQKSVLKELLNIQYGELTTYKKIAEKLGKESAVRAVGNIIGKNPLLIIVPCHRVIGSNGKMTGYVAGTEKKEALIEFEKCNI